ncbi:SsrA-binding protein [Weissella beninensis]|uniref:SsrA-binding protein n=1 Tax=Periweissella beninensis TaxID=504936 RepID=A0ABT0VFY5_9LACO|nr:SsrA-binding protein SmpB [Periweissella beninensis]MBM7543731.1 SsrA-binding protein [Periweissella beninensis]MCM2436710.1 SsrA-binding protein SmpB [Periweissella beninensis]
MKKPLNDTLANNRKAGYEYEILTTYEAGLALTGTEIKSVRAGQIQIADGYIQVRPNRAMLLNVHIAPFAQGNQFNVDPLRTRQLLLHKQEIKQLLKAVSDNGMTVVPLKVYIKHGYAKVLIGVARGKRQYDKRNDLKKKDQNREIQRALKRI